MEKRGYEISNEATLTTLLMTNGFTTLLIYLLISTIAGRLSNALAESL